MDITVNGENENLNKEISIKGYLLLNEISTKTVVIEHNKEIIDRSTWEKTVLADGDSLEIIHFVGGG